MRSYTWCLAWLLAATALPNCQGYAPNPPECVTSITGLVTAFSEAAKRICWASDACMLGWTSGFGVNLDATATHNTRDLRAYCAVQVSALVKLFAKAAKFMASAAFVCGNVDSGCAQQVFASITHVAALAQAISSAVNYCGSNRWWCAGSVADAAVDIVLLAQNIQTGLDVCSGIKYVPPSPPGFMPQASEAEPEPGAPEPQPDDPYGDQLSSPLFPGFSVEGSPVKPGSEGAERRLQAASVDLLDASARVVAQQRMEELRSSMDAFRMQLQQVLRKVDFLHAVHGEIMPEPLRSLEVRLDNATAEARALGLSDVEVRTQDRLQEVLSRFEDFQDAMTPSKTLHGQEIDGGSSQPLLANAPVVV